MENKARSGPAETKICSFCHEPVVRKYRRNRYGEYICQSCLKAGKRWSLRRTLWRAIRKKRHAAVYLVLGIAGLFVFYRVLEWLIIALQTPPE
jgi:hypothetical protein